MKLKSKLIATIVSICAAVAVMGVGVWAASTNFEVTVTNQVGFTFVGLDGTVKVSTAHSLDNATAAYTTESTGLGSKNLAGKVLYDGATATEPRTIKTISSEAEAGNNIQFEAADMFTQDYLTSKTIKGYLQYTFEYDAPTTVNAGESIISISVEQTSAPEATVNNKNAFDVYYMLTADGTNYIRMTAGAVYAVDATQDFSVVAVLVYQNPTAVSISAAETQWLFALYLQQDSAKLSQQSEVAASTLEKGNVVITPAGTSGATGTGAFANVTTNDTDAQNAIKALIKTSSITINKGNA